MLLSTMTTDEFSMALVEVLRGADKRITVILTDGNTLSGNLHVWDWRWGETELDKLTPEILTQGLGDSIELTCWKNDTQFAVRIPRSSIAGFFGQSYEQSYTAHEGAVSILRFSRTGDIIRDKSASANETFSTELLDKAAEYGFHVEEVGWLSAYRIGITTITWEDIEFKDSTPIYSDWEFFNRKSGGINSLGAGVAVVSLSAGWEKSLWSSFQKKVRSKTKAITETCASSEVVIAGHTNFLYAPSGAEIKLDMEGKDWIAAAVTKHRITEPNTLQQEPWVLAYFAADSFMFPQDLWEQIGRPVRFYGETTSAALEMDFGRADCYLKVRAAAYVKE